MAPPALQVCSDTIKWTTSYHHTNIDKNRRTEYQEVFYLSLLPELQEVGATKPAEALFVLDVKLWRHAGRSGESLQWERIGRTAKKICGSIGAGGTHVEWECEKLERAEPEPTKSLGLFRLKTTTPLRLVKGNKTCYNLNIKLTFHLGGSLKDQIPLLSDLLYPLPSPRPGSSYDDSVSLVSRPPNLALQISLTEPNRIHPVWVQEERLAAASSYLARLVRAITLPEDVLFATRAFDGRDDFDAVEDNSDDEEDTRRYKLFKESGNVGDNEEDRRSEAPEPAQQNGDGKEPPAKKSKPNPDEEDSDEEHSDEEEEGREMLQAASRPIWPAIMDTRAPRDGTQIIGVPDCALSTLQAVIIWIVTGVIVFAPLSVDGKEKRTASIQLSVKEWPRRPVPVSPRSVYRLAERFKMDKLASIALDDFEEKLAWANAGALALHIDCKHYSQIEELVHEYVRKNWDYIRGHLDKIVLKDVFEFVLYANLVKPIAGKLRTSYY